MWANIGFFISAIGMMIILGVGTVAFFSGEIPIIVGILILWCDAVGILAISNRIYNIIKENRKQK